MKLTNPEKLMLLMLSEIYEKNGLVEVDAKLIKSSIFSGNTWALTWKMHGLFGTDADVTPPLVTEVADYLGMWVILEEAYEKFDKSNKSRIKNEAGVFGAEVRFPGFDGNEEAELCSIARTFIKDIGIFERLNGRDLNSHAPHRSTYSKMHEQFKLIPSKTYSLSGLSPDQVIQVLRATETA